MYADLSIRENLKYFARIVGASAGRIEEVAAHRRARAAARGTTWCSLSGGERARASLAVALLGRPEVLVLDEPTVGLDPILRRELWRRSITCAEEGATLLVSSHVMDEAAHCDHLVLMREGRVIAAASPDEIRRGAGTDDLGRRASSRSQETG